MVFGFDEYRKNKKKQFSPRKYLAKGFIGLVIIAAFYYFYIGKMNNSLNALFGNEDKQEPEQTVQIWPAQMGIVTGILYSEENPSAVIDKDIVHEGDSVHGVKVVKIHQEEVEFEKAGKRWVQKVKEEPKRELVPTVDEK